MTKVPDYPLSAMMETLTSNDSVYEQSCQAMVHNRFATATVKLQCEVRGQDWVVGVIMTNKTFYLIAVRSDGLEWNNAVTIEPWDIAVKAFTDFFKALARVAK